MGKDVNNIYSISIDHEKTHDDIPMFIIGYAGDPHCADSLVIQIVDEKDDQIDAEESLTRFAKGNRGVMFAKYELMKTAVLPVIPDVKYKDYPPMNSK